VLNQDQVKHLEMIQVVINRLATSSFLIKGWALTIAAAFFAILAGRLSWKISLAGFIPLVAFWLLDAYYLRKERMFRRLYDDVRRPGTTVEPFEMETARYAADVTLSSIMLSATLRFFYCALLVVNLAFLFGAAIGELT
jgi:hypothetical protein